MKINRSKEWWLAKIDNEPDVTIGAGVTDTPTSLGTFIDQDGGVWPITNYFDIAGEECGADEAYTAVAGAGDKWFAFRVEDMERPSVQ